MLSENDISLSGFLGFKIFATSDQEFKEIASDQSKEFTSLVVYEPTADIEVLEIFLSNILTAAKLDLSKDVCLLKITAETGFSYIKFKTKVPIEKVILFGISPIKLGINLDLKLYTPMVFQNCIFLLADHLAIIQADVNKKRELWACLQKIYLK
jgi:hypothetical protein